MASFSTHCFLPLFHHSLTSSTFHFPHICQIRYSRVKSANQSVDSRLYTLEIPSLDSLTHNHYARLFQRQSSSSPIFKGFTTNIILLLLSAKLIALTQQNSQVRPAGHGHQLLVKYFNNNLLLMLVSSAGH
jgi:hypothetical protein